jgi:hypothetical protein
MLRGMASLHNLHPQNREKIMASEFRYGEFRPRQVTVQAWRIDFANKPLPQWVNDAFRTEAIDWLPSGDGLFVNTKGGMNAANGEILIRDEDRGLLICSAADFAKDYEPADYAPAVAAPRQLTEPSSSSIRAAFTKVNDQFGHLHHWNATSPGVIAFAQAVLALAAKGTPAAPQAAPLVEEKPDDVLTVAHISHEDSGSTLTLHHADLGNLVDILGEDEETYTVRIAGMPRAEFEALGDFNGL